MTERQAMVPTGRIEALETPRFDSDVAIERLLMLLDVKQSTRNVYKYGLRDFTAWNATQTVDAAIVLRYKQFLRERVDLSTSTKNLYLSAVRALTSQMYLSGAIERDFGKGVKGFTQTRGHKKSPISDEQVEKVFAYLKKKNDKRLTLIFTLLFFQGLRQKEIITARIEDFNAGERTLMIWGKARDDQERIDLHPQTVAVIERFLALSGLKSGFFLYSKKNPKGHMSSIQLGRIIRELHAACDIKNSGHAWRKVFTSKLIDSGLDLLSVASFTRHKSIEMLKIYYDRLDKQKKLPLYYDTFHTQT